MLTPEEMAAYPDNIDEMYQELDEFIIKDYARRVAKAGRVTDTAEWIAQRGEAIGLSEEEIQRETARILEMSEEEVEEIFEDAALTSAENDAERFASAGITAGRASSYAAVVRFLDAATKQTGGELKNITGTMGVAVDNEGEDLTDFYQRTLDYVQLQVSSGVTDYNTAIRNAVKKLAAKGIQFIDYESGKRMNIASAARMCTLTGICQMARQMNEAVCDDLGFDIVETTAHPGARPSHMVWQGRLFSRSGRSKQYPPLEQSTGLGTAGGLCGVNCRHSYYGVPEGATRTWTDEELANIDPPPFTYEGKEYTYYEANQRMRYMERQMRKTKREAVGYEAAGLDDDFTAASIKLNRQRQEYKKFAKTAGIRPKYERTQELGYDRSVSSKAVWRNRKNTGARRETLADRYERREKESKRFYNERRQDDSDISKISKTTGFSETKVRQIKEHLFVNEHILDDGVRRFDEDYDIAVAWKRLSDGNPEERDILLLEHEYLESTVEKEYNLTYREAHDIAEEQYAWDVEMDKMFEGCGEDVLLYETE